MTVTWPSVLQLLDPLKLSPLTSSFPSPGPTCPGALRKKYWLGPGILGLSPGLVRFPGQVSRFFSDSTFLLWKMGPPLSPPDITMGRGRSRDHEEALHEGGLPCLLW